jgi:hypothetical protein
MSASNPTPSKYDSPCDRSPKKSTEISLEDVCDEGTEDNVWIWESEIERIKWIGHVARMGGKRYMYKIVIREV